VADAGYWSYLWSEVFAYDVIAPFDEHSLDDNMGGAEALRSLGMRFRRELLEPCASVPADRMLENFLGRPPTDAAWIAKVVQHA
jgi:Zn-dependent oligopeptidase